LSLRESGGHRQLLKQPKPPAKMNSIPYLIQGEAGPILWLVVPTLTLLLWNIISLLRNYLSVRSSQIPAYICPANPTSIPWIISAVPLKPLLRAILPDFVFDRIRPTFYGWEFFSRWELHKKFGEMFFISTPGINDLWIADPEAANDILKRPKDFLPLVGTELVAGLFGPNLITSHGEQWQRQRRLIAPNFNEGVSALVWSEACSQASEMLDYFLEYEHGETDETIHGLRQIAIHVIGSAGYGQHTSWRSAMSKSQEAHSAGAMTYVEALHSIIDHLIPAAFLPPLFFTLPGMPQWMRDIGTAKQRFPELTKDILDKEREETKTRTTTRKTLLSTLVALSDAEESSAALTEEQISGNMFLFTVAGYDTTANSLAYGITILASSPKWQDWLLEEITQSSLSPESAYETIFPSLMRTRAFMFETLRLFTPLVHLGRRNPAPQTITTRHGPRLVPAGTQCYVNGVALHVDPGTWGSDALEFNPMRWLSPSSSEEEELITPPRGTFIPWSTGPRICPGMKMAQVEFVGVLFTMLRRCRIEAVRSEGESEEGAQKRLGDVMQDSQSRLTLQMNRPSDVRLRFIKR
jgi:cytochrome P450